MKALTVLLVSAMLAATSCTKDKLPSGDDAAIASASSSTANKVDDNPNGGGGNNIAASAVPTAVRNAFNTRYPGATRAEWKLKNGQYKVEFFIGTVRWQAIFTPNGTLVKQERA